MKPLPLESLEEGLLKGDRRMLSKAITLVESSHPDHRKAAGELLRRLLPHTGRSLRVGITGVPGAGKSTFIESFGLLCIGKGHRVAVLAVDPSSTRNQGSILGDKTRMEELSRHPSAYIRPSPSRGELGGIANTTFESMLLCEAAGYDLILIETVGVGQSEVVVSDISDVFMLLKLTGAGDELQGIKRGVMEMVDLIFLNKVTQENRDRAKLARQELLRALYFLPEKQPGWKVPVLMGAALEGLGLNEIYDSLQSFVQLKKKNGLFEKDRQQQAVKRFEYWVREYLIQKLSLLDDASGSYKLFREQVRHLQANPSTQAQELVDRIWPKD